MKFEIERLLKSTEKNSCTEGTDRSVSKEITRFFFFWNSSVSTATLTEVFP
jgi:hypothetical protein